MLASLPQVCPVCGEEITVTYHREIIPYFSDILIISAACECGYRFADIIILGEGDPVRWTMKVDDPDALSVRVVRSTSGRLEIPEMGLKVEPGPACLGFVSNVEGVLNRFEGAVEQALSGVETEADREKAIAVREKIAMAKEGRFPFTLILEDPSGNSAIISKKAKKTTPAPNPQ